MSAIVVGYVDKPEGRAALRRAAEEAGRRGFPLILVQAVPDSTSTVSAAVSTLAHDTALTGTLAAVGIEHTVRDIPAGDDYADGLIAIAEEVAADMIVIGLRRRSPVGKLILGSNAQRILLDAPCPVLAVKAGAPTDED
jgi:nucleotide-binding universal stress UspA family protein